MDSHSLPVLPSPQMGLSLNLNGMDIVQQAPKVEPGIAPGHADSMMHNNMFLRLSSPGQGLEPQGGISPAQLRQMHMMDAVSTDASRLAHPIHGSLHHAEDPSITNNADLLKAFSTMSAEQQSALLSNINTKLMHNHGNGTLSDSRQHSGHSINKFLPQHQSPFPDVSVPMDVPPPPVPSSSSLSSGHGHMSRGGAFVPASPFNHSRYTKDPGHGQGFGSLLAQAVQGKRGAPAAACEQKQQSASLLADIDVQVPDATSVQHPGSAVSTSTQDRINPALFSACGRLSAGSEPLAEIEPASPSPPSPPQKKQRSSQLQTQDHPEQSDDQPKNPNRNMSGVPEWSQAEVDAVMRLYHERGRLPKWKPIADELARQNVKGQLNSVLLQKGMSRSNNAVMNKVKEILYKEQGEMPSRYERDPEVVPKRNTAGVPEWNEAEINMVLQLWNKHGRQSEWKSISLELASLNATGELNSELAAKGLQRTNNAVMNKVKELSGISRARRSRPRTLGNFAPLLAEQGCRSIGHGGMVIGPDSKMYDGSDGDRFSMLMARVSSDGCLRGGLDGSQDSSGPALGGRWLSVVSPVALACQPPVLLQQEAFLLPAVPHVSPVPQGGLHSSPVVQQEPME